MAKPHGWWTTHPSILNVSVAGAWDSNGDGIGDFEGIRRHLDWLAGAGISGIRFQQVTRFGDDFEWHGLVAQDWFDVDPLYGTMADFDRLMADCRSRDFRILVMAVPEYVGWHHPAYVAARKARTGGVSDPRQDWFTWEDDGAVRTVWNHPGLDTSHAGFLGAYLAHLAFWMDKGISGFDADAVHDWRNLSVATERKICDMVKARGGFITAECFVLSNDILRQGGWNAGTGQWRTRLYNELDALLEGNADHVRKGLAARRQLVDLGMFPYQQFGDEMLSRYTGKNFSHKLPMWRLQVAFNAALPDQVWVLANAITYPTRETSRTLPGLRA